MALIGAVVGDSDAIAMFPRSNQSKNCPSATGETHSERVLNSILGREVTLKRPTGLKCSAFGRQEAPAGSPAKRPAPVFLLAGIVHSVREAIRLADESSQPGQRATIDETVS